MKRIISIVLVTAVFLSFSIESNAKGITGFELTEEYVLSVLDKYDSDDAFIIHKAVENGEDITRWWHKDRGVLSFFNICVHEECHFICGKVSNRIIDSNLREGYYLGNGKTEAVVMGDVFHSKEMAESIPKKYRSFRYDEYINPEDDIHGSDQFGIYGLLNEFNAYCRGLITCVALYDYLKDKEASAFEWIEWYNSCENDRLAFAEFRYYMFFYLNYAKNKYPDIYNEILNNEKFIACYRLIENTFIKAIFDYENLLPEMRDLLRSRGYIVFVNGNLLIINLKSVLGYKRAYNKMLEGCLQFEEEANALGAEHITVNEDIVQNYDGESALSWVKAKWEQIKETAKQIYRSVLIRIEELKEKAVILFETLKNKTEQFGL